MKDHNTKLIAQIKKDKVTKHYSKNLEQEREDVEEELKKNLSKKSEENVCLKNLNQRLLEQIISLKDENKDTKNKVNNPKNEEF